MLDVHSDEQLMHGGAISHEIGERLRLVLDRDRSPVPSYLRELLHRFDGMDAQAGRQSSPRTEAR
jgi:hypothetical protein